MIIPDTRFPNEIDLIKSAYDNVDFIKVVRPGFDNGLTEEQKNHPSETALDDIEADYTFYNDGTLDDLIAKVIDWKYDKNA